MTEVLSDVDVSVLNAMQSVTAALSDVDVSVPNHVQSVTAVLSDVYVICAESRAVTDSSSLRC